VARIKANLRKNDKPVSGNLIYKDIIIDSAKHQITVNGTQIQTTLKEYNLLCLLCQNAEKVQTREGIFMEVWGDNFVGESRTLDIHIKEIRKKLSATKSEVAIQTIRGVGYILT
jgi:two-component system alkaline phosphatase synthesis response regulator PhoP